MGEPIGRVGVGQVIVARPDVDPGGLPRLPGPRALARRSRLIGRRAQGVLDAPRQRDAVRRGRLAVERVGGRNLVTVVEIERYRAEVLGTRGWEERKADGGEGEPATGQGARVRQRAYRARKRAQASV